MPRPVISVMTSTFRRKRLYLGMPRRDYHVVALMVWTSIQIGEHPSACLWWLRPLLLSSGYANVELLPQDAFPVFKVLNIVVFALA